MGNVALVTGAAKRLGKSIALCLARRGWDIALHYSTSEHDAQAAADEIRRIGPRCELVQADLSDATQVRTLMSQATGKLGPLSLLVNNASIFERSEFLQTDEDLFDRHFDANFRAPFFLSRDFARQATGPAHIINLIDAGHTKAARVYFAYALTKKVLAEFTTMAAKALGPRIRVNGICPGPILPPPGGSIDDLRQVASKVPLQRAGTVAEITAAVEFLLDNQYVTGQLLYIDGGQHIP